MNAEERTQIHRFLEDFEECFDGDLGDWDPYPINLELKPGSKYFDIKCYPVPRINKNTFYKELTAGIDEAQGMSLQQRNRFWTPSGDIDGKQVPGCNR